ncbi:MAG: glycoside hydrolase [Candidatus Omnitrophota bacterium]
MARKSVIKKRVEFKVAAPNANWVGVAGDFNGWRPDALTAKKDRSGNWKASAMMSSGTYEYKFVIDGTWLTDSGCSRRTINSYGSENSVLVVN